MCFRRVRIQTAAACLAFAGLDVENPSHVSADLDFKDAIRVALGNEGMDGRIKRISHFRGHSLPREAVARME